MVQPNRLLCGLFAVLLVGGCAVEPQSSGQLTDRLTSATEITVAGPRDAALAEIAKDAAYANEADISLNAVDGMAPSALRDQTAQACAATLNQLGRRDKADAMVGRIGSVATRDRIREAYAATPAPMRGF